MLSYSRNSQLALWILALESFGSLVWLSFVISDCTPATYLRSSLLRPSMEISSWSEFRA
jgi:hypothetical protein